MSAVGIRMGRRLIDVIVVVVLVVILTNLLIRLAPGDPARAILGVRASETEVAALRHDLTLDRPVSTQIWDSLTGTLTGDLGNSLSSRSRSVASIIGDAAPVTLTLIAGSVLISLLIGVPLGLWAGVTSRKPVSTTISGASIAFLGMPPFVLALLLLLVVALGLGLAPAGGWGDGWPAHLWYAWLPSLALSGLIIPQVIRTVRQTAGELARQEFIEAAVSRGIPQRTIMLRHVLPNTALPLITILGFNCGALVGGAVVVEAVFGLPGLGTALSASVTSRDYTVISGIAMATAIFVVLVNLLTDFLYTVIDPRVRVPR